MDMYTLHRGLGYPDSGVNICIRFASSRQAVTNSSLVTTYNIIVHIIRIQKQTEGNLSPCTRFLYSQSEAIVIDILRINKIF